MALMTEYSESGNFTMPTGTIQAVCCGVYDLGKKETTYQGKTRTGYHTILMFELIEEMETGKRYSTIKWYSSRNFSISTSYKPGLQKDIEAWFNMTFTEDQLREGINLEELYGKNVFLNIIKDKEKFKIVSLSPVPKNIERILPHRNLEDVPDFVKKHQANNLKEGTLTGDSPENFDDDIPF